MNLPVVDILKYGLPGFCFLLAYMAYLLIKKEQSRTDPRPAFNQSVRTYMGLVLVLGVLVGAQPLIQRLLDSPAPPFKIEGPVKPHASILAVYGASTRDVLSQNERRFRLEVPAHKNDMDCQVIFADGQSNSVILRARREDMSKDGTIHMQGVDFANNNTTGMAEVNKKPDERSSYIKLDTAPLGTQAPAEYQQIAD
jgi:hypothetical protein